MLNVEVIDELKIVFHFLLSIIFAGIFFMCVVLIAIAVNQFLHFVGITFSNSIIVVSNGLVLKSYIMLADYLVVGAFVTMTTILAFSKMWFLGRKHFLHMKDN